jgi:hypothetical protein
MGTTSIYDLKVYWIAAHKCGWDTFEKTIAKSNCMGQQLNTDKITHLSKNRVINTY